MLLLDAIDQEFVGRVLIAAGIVVLAMLAGWALRSAMWRGAVEAARLRGVQQGRELAEDELLDVIVDRVRRDLEAEEREALEERVH